MCDIEYTQSDVFRDTRRRARKPYRCSACGGNIEDDSGKGWSVMSVDVLHIVAAYLKAKWLDGMYSPDGGCACVVGDLAPCGQIHGCCEPGYRRDFDDDGCDGGQCGGGCEWHIQKEKPPALIGTRERPYVNAPPRMAITGLPWGAFCICGTCGTIGCAIGLFDFYGDAGDPLVCNVCAGVGLTTAEYSISYAMANEGDRDPLGPGCRGGYLESMGIATINDVGPGR